MSTAWVLAPLGLVVIYAAWVFIDMGIKDHRYWKEWRRQNPGIPMPPSWD